MSSNTYLIVILTSECGQVLRSNIPEIFQVFRLSLIAALNPFHLLGAVIFYPMNLEEPNVNQKLTIIKVLPEECNFRAASPVAETCIVLYCPIKHIFAEPWAKPCLVCKNYSSCSIFPAYHKKKTLIHNVQIVAILPKTYLFNIYLRN